MQKQGVYLYTYIGLSLTQVCSTTSLRKIDRAQRPSVINMADKAVSNLYILLAVKFIHLTLSIPVYAINDINTHACMRAAICS